MPRHESPHHAISAGMGRRLAAILHADVEGYSRLIAHDEEATLLILTPYLQMMKEMVRQHGGQAIGSRGDSLLAEFPSVRSAVQCAVELQYELKERNAALPTEQRIAFRMGIHVGEVVEDGEQLHGDGINIAVRLEELAAAGGILISGTVYDQVKNKLALQYEALGEQQLKNIPEPVRVYRVVLNEAAWAIVEATQRNRPQTQQVGTSLRLRSVFVLVFVSVALIAGILAVRYFPFSTSNTQHPTPSTEALPLPDKPSIAVLPFVNMSGDPAQEYFSDGLTEDLITDLSKLSGLFVIARNSAFTYKGKAVKVEQVSREFGVRYVLEGSVRKAEGQVRITAQLVDATAGYPVWAERYDRPLKDVFALQEDITHKIVAALQVEVQEAELKRVRHTPTESLTAYDSLLRGWAYYNRLLKEGNGQARQMFKRAIALDPMYAAAYAFLGFTYLREWIWQWSQDPHTLERAFALAQQAIALDDSLANAHMLLSQVYLFTRQHEQALAEGERAIGLDPNNADGYARLGLILSWAGQPGEAIGRVEQAMRLNPRYPDFYLFFLGQAYFLAGRDAEAMTTFKKLLQVNPHFPGPRLYLAAIYSESGQEGDARAEVAEVLKLNPNYSLEGVRQRVPFKDPGAGERFLAALRKAGLK